MIILFFATVVQARLISDTGDGLLWHRSNRNETKPSAMNKAGQTSFLEFQLLRRKIIVLRGDFLYGGISFCRVMLAMGTVSNDVFLPMHKHPGLEV